MIKDTFIPSNYLLEKDLKRIREIKILVKHSNSLKDIFEYEKEIEYLIKKAYVRKQMIEKEI